jgi:hypothetical protein
MVDVDPMTASAAVESTALIGATISTSYPRLSWMSLHENSVKNGMVQVDPIGEWPSSLAARGGHFAAISRRILLLASSDCVRIGQRFVVGRVAPESTRDCAWKTVEWSNWATIDFWKLAIVRGKRTGNG